LPKKVSFKLYVEYDGSKFFGIQRQSFSPTVESVLKTAALKIFGNDVMLLYCGRTDRGVHSVGMPMWLTVESLVCLDSFKVKEALNSVLTDLRVTKCFKQFSNTLNIRKSTFGREYFFLFSKEEPSVFLQHMVGSVECVIDLEVLGLLSNLVVGRFDFMNFSNKNGNESNGTWRTLYSCRVKKLNAFSEFQRGDGQSYCLSVVGQGFLYNMIRNILGAFLACSQNRLLVEEFEKALTRDDECKRFYKTVDPNGLVFRNATYINY
jgi:tRNA pseudouridine38-40 synthase